MPPMRLWGDFQFVKRTIVLVFGKEKLEEKQKAPRRKALNIKHLEFPRGYYICKEGRP
jgi:hypothetical protein